MAVTEVTRLSLTLSFSCLPHSYFPSLLSFSFLPRSQSVGVSPLVQIHCLPQANWKSMEMGWSHYPSQSSLIVNSFDVSSKKVLWHLPIRFISFHFSYHSPPSSLPLSSPCSTTSLSFVCLSLWSLWSQSQIWSVTSLFAPHPEFCHWFRRTQASFESIQSYSSKYSASYEQALSLYLKGKRERDFRMVDTANGALDEQRVSPLKLLLCFQFDIEGSAIKV